MAAGVIDAYDSIKLLLSIHQLFHQLLVVRYWGFCSMFLVARQLVSTTVIVQVKTMLSVGEAARSSLKRRECTKNTRCKLNSHYKNVYSVTMIERSSTAKKSNEMTLTRWMWDEIDLNLWQMSCSRIARIFGCVYAWVWCFNVGTYARTLQSSNVEIALDPFT